jgi:hypothetical protein
VAGGGGGLRDVLQHRFALHAAQGMIMVSADQVHWYDKTHSATGLAIAADGSFNLAGWAWDPQGDSRVPYFGMWVVPASYNFATFVCEGVPPPASLTTAAVAVKVVHRDQPMPDPGAGSGGRPATPSPAPGGNGGGGNPAPAASPTRAAAVEGPSSSPATRATGGASAVAVSGAGIAAVAALTLLSAVWGAV